MLIQPFQRLTSNTTTVFLGTDRDKAARNAANGTGTNPDLVARFPTWPSLQKFDNDDSFQNFSPFGDFPNPQYLWDQPPSDGKTVAFAIASEQFTIPASLTNSFSVFLNAFADNAMEAKIELFERIGGSFVKADPQPLDEFFLIAGDPNTPAEGLTETKPFNWQDIRVYSTRFQAPFFATSSIRIFKIVVSFEVTNYLPRANNPNNPNPAGLQFMVDIYAVIPRILYVANDVSGGAVEIYNITNPTAPVRAGEFDTRFPAGLAITGTILYVTDRGAGRVKIYDITLPTVPDFFRQFGPGEPFDPVALAITGTTLYVAYTDGLVEIYDITNPIDPVHVGEFGAEDLNVPMALAITGTTLYVANTGDNTVEIYDITNPTAPVRVDDEFNSGNLSGPRGLAITGTTLYVANFGNNTVEIYNISTPTAPVRTGQFNTANLSNPRGLAITGTTLYVSNFGDITVEIYDISNPAAPVRRRQFGVGSDPFGLAILG